VHSGDFKLDYTPVGGKPTDFSRLAQLGQQGVLLLMSDSTHVELCGYTPSEKVVGDTIESIIAKAQGRVIVTTFASLISRIQQIINAATIHERRVFLVGRSMSDTCKMALSLGYIKAPEGTFGHIDDVRNLAPNKVVLITTGSQGEPTSALVRMANRDHRQLNINKGDTVIVSSSPIPGNETLVNRTIDSLFKQGAEVYYDRISPVHVHGHASQEELKLMISLTKPKFFMPIHGEYRHLSLHAKLAQSLGIPENSTFVLEDGDILELTTNSGKVVGRVPAGNVYVDGLSVGDVGGVVLRTRRTLSRDGIVVVIVAVNHQTGEIVGRPDIISRGFVDPRENQSMLDRSRELVIKVMDHHGKRLTEWGNVNNRIRDTLSKFYYDETHCRPMVLPVMVKV
jgi:ribonuclease J